ncbi:isochorismatase family protein [Paucibacter sp. R3-3]|uniref:Isochorismatase family protein n=1 Tax=Roseateles agri TaxID=3098619 RepID=A0ABU5DKJ7_9BURK|nr:isochorismatase family protein [Paucibacter sp. R3-3]MDY0746828.1 isochorismatase family protein [Paucibacter sp. R3-3]
MGRPALIVIDIQNDYFEGGAFPLWNARETLAAASRAAGLARDKGLPVVFVQHVARGPAPFFQPDTVGVQLHDEIRAIVADSPVITKQHADAFAETTLHDTLQALGVDALIVCGMMTQNCVTHTAISRRADDYRDVTVLTDASTTVSEILHRIALNGLTTRVRLASVDEALANR